MTTTKIRAQAAAAAAAPSSLAAAAVATGGTFAAATYFWKITFATRWGETQASAEATVAIVLNGSANLTWTAPPAGTISVNIYRGTVTNTENHLVGTAAGNAAAFTDTGLAGSVQSPPAAPAAYSNVTLDALGRALQTDTVIGAQPTAAQLQALQAANEWHNAGGAGDGALRAQATAAALNLSLQEV